nr:hypothetical protein [Chromobacterium violaceum]
MGGDAAEAAKRVSLPLLRDGLSQHRRIGGNSAVAVEQAEGLGVKPGAVQRFVQVGLSLALIGQVQHDIDFPPQGLRQLMVGGGRHFHFASC